MADRAVAKPCLAAVGRLIRDLPGGSPAFVMATGIVSIADDLVGRGGVAEILFAINLVAFPVLSVALLLRLVRYPSAFLTELRDDRRGPGLLTIVAGTSVFGDQIRLLTPHQSVAAGLWLGALAIWVCLIYCVFTAATLRPAKLSLGVSFDGNWLLAVVATQSLAILGIGVEEAFSAPEILVFISLCLFLVGAVFYLIIITLILYRWLFEEMRPEQLTPSYWINMGAAAIATVAAVQLVPAVRSYPALADTAGFVIGQAVLFWSVATWWLPMLIAVMVWRHLIGGVALTYRYEYWSMVFPLGMYTVATFGFAQQVGMPALSFVPRIFLWIAVAAWCVVFFGLLRDLAHDLRLSLAAPAENAGHGR
jgi:tellurite resistance protein TehA-like permease